MFVSTQDLSFLATLCTRAVLQHTALLWHAAHAALTKTDYVGMLCGINVRTCDLEYGPIA